LNTNQIHRVVVWICMAMNVPLDCHCHRRRRLHCIHLSNTTVPPCEFCTCKICCIQLSNCTSDKDRVSTVSSLSPTLLASASAADPTSASPGALTVSCLALIDTSRCCSTTKDSLLVCAAPCDCDIDGGLEGGGLQYQHRQQAIVSRQHRYCSPQRTACSAQCTAHSQHSAAEHRT
jgi:hypothetical protein